MATTDTAGVPRPVLIRWLLHVTGPVLRPLLGSTLCRIADLALGVALFALAAHAVVAAAQGQGGQIWTTVVVMSLISLAKAVLRYGEQFLGHFVAFKALELIRAEIFAALIPRAPRVMMTARSGDLLARSTKDVDRIEVFFAHTFAPMVSAILVPLGVVIWMGVTASWLIAAIALAFLIAAILLVPLAGWGRSLRASREVAGQRAHLTQHVTDSVQGMSEVVGYGRTGERLARMGEIDDAVAQAAWPAHRWASIRRGTIELLVIAGPLTIALAGAWQYRGGEGLSLAALAACVAAQLRLAETIRGVEEFAASLNASFASAERVWALVHAPVEVADGDEELDHRSARTLRWESVSYSYPTSRGEVLHDVSVTASAGTWTCLVGASGSGKSTLAGLAVRSDDPASGCITLDGRDIRQLRGEDLRREIALVTQKAHLFRASVIDNVRLAVPEASAQEVEQACRLAGIHDDIVAMPQGYDTMIGERGSSLSGGQRQRIALARAILAQPAVIILDEFTSHLDPALDARVRAQLRQALPEATVVEITHRINHIADADHVAVLDAGQLLQSGTPRQLLSSDGPLTRLAAREQEPVLIQEGA